MSGGRITSAYHGVDLNGLSSTETVFTLAGGSITGNGNTAVCGVQAVTKGRLVMTGGTISGWTYGIQDANIADCTVVMSGGSVNNNTNGIVLRKNNELCLSGTPVIRNNEVMDFQLASNRKIMISRPLSDGASIGISANEPMEFVDGWRQYMSGEDPEEFLVSRTEGYRIIPWGEKLLFSPVETGVIVGGKCGDQVQWTLTDNGFLKIYGNGDMTSSPWTDAEYRNAVNRVEIQDGVTSISSFGYCQHLASITIPDSVERIEPWAFCNCDSLTGVIIPDSVIYLGNEAFWLCFSLKSVILPPKLTRIENYTFGYCRSLTNITIPESVVSIGTQAFVGCTALSDVTIPANVTSIGDTAFNACERICVLSRESDLTNSSFSSNATIYCYADSDAHEWAVEHEADVILLDGEGTGSISDLSVPESIRVSLMERTGIPAVIFPRTNDQVISWRSGDESIVKVDRNGMLTPVKPGKATIVLSVDNQEVQTQVTVTPAAESIGIDYDELYAVLSGESTNIRINVQPTGAVCQFKCEVADINMIDTSVREEDGLYRLSIWNWGENTGLTALSLTDVYSNKTISVPVRKVRNVKRVTIDESEIVLKQGDVYSLDADVELSNGTHTTQLIGISCQMTDTGIASVDFTGSIKALSPGDTTLFITANSSEAGYQDFVIAVHVVEPPASYLPDKLTEIEAGAFYGTDIERIIIPDGCTTIGSGAFANCTKLRVIYIPNSVTSISPGAFAGCANVAVYGDPEGAAGQLADEYTNAGFHYVGADCAQ